MISKQGLSDLAADVRDINYGNSIKELVFNPETGDFEACTRGTSHGSGEIVTEMTEGGFAAEMQRTPLPSESFWMRKILKH